MGKYEEEIYDRAEHQFKDVKKQIAWLSSFEKPERGANAYTGDAVRVRNQLIKITQLEEDIISTKEYENLEELEKEAKSLPSYMRGGLVKGIESKKKRIEKRREDIQKDFDDIKNLTDLDNAKKRLKNLSDEIDISTLEEQLEGIRISISEQRISDRRARIKEDIDRIKNLTDLDNAKRRIKRLSKKEDVSDLEKEIEEIRLGLEEQREIEREEKIRITKKQQEEARERKERLREEGFEPSF